MCVCVRVLCFQYFICFFGVLVFINFAGSVSRTCQNYANVMMRKVVYQPSHFGIVEKFCKFNFNSTVQITTPVNVKLTWGNSHR